MLDLRSLPPEELSEAERLAVLDLTQPGTRQQFLNSLTESQLAGLDFDWGFWGRPDQQWPTDAELAKLGMDRWSILLLSCGRGAGKTLTGSQLTRHWVAQHPGEWGALVAPTAADARDVMIEGPAGLVNVCPPSERPMYYPTKKRLVFPNGAVLLVYSAAEPEDLRGANAGFAWCDELAKWTHLQEAWDNLRFALRGTSAPKTIITTTPKPLPLFKRLVNKEVLGTIVRRFSTYRNSLNLPEDFLNEILASYEGTRLGRQEIYADLLTDVEGALWTPEMIESAISHPTLSRSWTISPGQDTSLPSTAYRRVVVGVDPSGSSTGDECGIVVAAERNNTFHILADYSLRASPDQWAKKVISAYHSFNANQIIAEKNFGGEMVSSVIRAQDPLVPVKLVNASRGKYQRAEPISQLYERSLVAHHTRSEKLEEEMLSFVPGTLSSPNRLDALVWALTDLAVNHIIGNSGLVSATGRTLPGTKSALPQPAYRTRLSRQPARPISGVIFP